MRHRHHSRIATGGAVIVSLAALLGFGASACNSVTGADDVRINPDFDSSADDDTQSSPTGGPTSGSGGSTNAGAGSGATTSSGPSGSGPSTTTSTGSGTGGDPGPTECEYPAGPYGVAMGQTVPPTISWQGFAPGASTATTITMAELHDCDGTRGIHALYFDTSQFG